MTLLNFFYLYCALGILVTFTLLRRNKNKEKDISEIAHDKIHEMSNDGSLLFYSANFIGHLLAYFFSMFFWPVLIIKILVWKKS